jgi:glycosyltransferase involved in cell wall biosynthesis
MVVTTEAIANYVRQSNPSIEATVVPQGVDISRATHANHAEVRRQLLARSSLPSDTVIVGYHAPIICLSTDPDYQSEAFRHFYIDTLLEAVRRLWSDGLSFLALLVGRASQQIREIAYSEPRLVLKDYVDRDELFDWVGAFDIGTYPRTVDFHGRQSVKMLEYMATGAAIVAMSTSETKFVDEYSLGHAAADPAEFCSSLRSLIVDRDTRRELGERGRRFARRHDWDKLAGQYDALLAGVAAPV